MVGLGSGAATKRHWTVAAVVMDIANLISWTPGAADGSRRDGGAHARSGAQPLAHAAATAAGACLPSFT